MARVTAVAWSTLLLAVSALTAAEPSVGAVVPVTPLAVQPLQAAGTPDDRVGVLPFINISGAAEDDWIGAGIVETLTADLTRLLDVSVAGREPAPGVPETASSAAGAAETAEIAAGRLLRARWIISGAYQRVGDRLRITARLVEVATGRVAYTTIVDGMVTELFALQDRLVEDVGRRLGAGTGSARAPGGTPPASAEAASPPAPRAAVPEDAAVGRGSVASRSSWAPELTGRVFLEGRAFPGGAAGGLAAGNGSIAIEPEWHLEWGDGRQSLTVVPFLRLDQHDHERSHFDIRELTWDLVGDTWEIRAGVRKVFWGVTESTHLVDIVNQTDLVEDLDGEEKLGQPMVNVALIRDWGTVDLFMLLGFRERPFFGAGSRPGLPFPLDDDEAQFESRRGRKRIDWAARWSHAVGAFDVGVSYFHGTSRDPRFLPHAGASNLIPVYDIINQAGLELQMTSGGWLWKLEAINRVGQGDRYAAATAGFEYTFGNIATSGIDLGILTEYAFRRARRAGTDAARGRHLRRCETRAQRCAEHADPRRGRGRSQERGELPQRRGQPADRRPLDARRRDPRLRQCPPTRSIPLRDP